MPIIHVALSNDLLTSFVFLTVKKRIKICGNPAVPRIKASCKENNSMELSNNWPGRKNCLPNGVPDFTCSNIAGIFQLNLENTIKDKRNVPDIKTTVFTI